jgi:hypothetical protein
MIASIQVRLVSSLAAVLLAGALASAAVAQTPPTPPAAAPAPKATPAPKPAAKTEPSAWDKTKDMSRKEWNSAKGQWVMEKAKWKGCSEKSREQKLRGTKRWTFIGHCMTD